MYQPQLSDLSLPTFGQLREQAVELFYQAPLEPWTDIELANIRRVVADHCKRHPRRPGEWEFEPGIAALSRDLEGAHALPKWICIVNWLSPDSVQMQRLMVLVSTLVTLAFEGKLAHPE